MSVKCEVEVKEELLDCPGHKILEKTPTHQGNTHQRGVDPFEEIFIQENIKTEKSEEESESESQPLNNPSHNLNNETSKTYPNSIEAIYFPENIKEVPREGNGATDSEHLLDVGSEFGEKTKEWTQDQSLHLIEQYRNHELIWNSKHKYHTDPTFKQLSWKKIAQNLNRPVDECRKKMECLLSGFRKERMKLINSIGSGKVAEEIYKSKWFAYNSLSFLLDKNKPRGDLTTCDLIEDKDLKAKETEKYISSELIRMHIGENFQKYDNETLIVAADQGEQGSKVERSGSTSLTPVTFDQDIEENCQDYLRCRFYAKSGEQKPFKQQKKVMRPRRSGKPRTSDKPVSLEQDVTTARRTELRKLTPITTTNPFKTKNTGAEPSALKNDPYYNAEIVMPGYNLTPVTQPRHFEIDFSGYITLIHGSYASLTEFDRGMGKYISFSMYQYYCVIGLWKRLIDVIANTSGDDLITAAQLEKVLPEMTYPKEISQYLDGVGNLVDHAGIRVDLKLQHNLVDQPVNGGAQGSFGRVDGQTHIYYETLPALIVSLYRIYHDALYTEGVDQREWDLPENLIPAQADNAHQPTSNLLGWGLASKLTSEQIQTLEDTHMVLDQQNLSFGVENVGCIPINKYLLMTITNYLLSSKLPSTTKPGSHIMGSIGQICWQTRDRNDHEINRTNIADKSSATAIVAPLIPNVTFMASMMRFRIDRSYDDTYCYTLQANTQRSQPWIVTKNDVFNYGYARDNWNTRRYGSGYSSGFINTSRLSRIYRYSL